MTAYLCVRSDTHAARLPLAGPFADAVEQLQAAIAPHLSPGEQPRWSVHHDGPHYIRRARKPGSRLP